MAKRDLTREELFAMVWERPTTEIASSLGISDVAVGKLCEKLQVPKPPRGYWARVEAGQSPRRPALKAFREELEVKRKGSIQARSAGHFTELQSKFVNAALDELRKCGVELQVDTSRMKHISSFDQDVAAQVAPDPGAGAEVGGEWSGCRQLGDVGQGKRRKTRRAIDAACPSAVACFRDGRQTPFLFCSRSDCIRQMDDRTTDQNRCTCGDRQDPGSQLRGAAAGGGRPCLGDCPVLSSGVRLHSKQLPMHIGGCGLD